MRYEDKMRKKFDVGLLITLVCIFVLALSLVMLDSGFYLVGLSMLSISVLGICVGVVEVIEAIKG